MQRYSPAQLDKWACGGPTVVEIELGKIAGQSLQGLDRYRVFLALLEERRLKKVHQPIISFLSGYFKQQIAGYFETDAEKQSSAQEGLAHYQEFLRSKGAGNSDIRYYSQWQVGVLMRILGEPWAQVEEAFLKCTEFDVTRGEALQDVLAYRCENQDWRIAYIYSRYCMRQFFTKAPTGRYWYTDLRFYDWKILSYHIPILISLRKKQEARELMAGLTKRVQQSPGDFTGRERLHIQEMDSALEENLIMASSIKSL